MTFAYTAAADRTVILQGHVNYAPFCGIQGRNALGATGLTNFLCQRYGSFPQLLPALVTVITGI